MMGWPEAAAIAAQYGLAGFVILGVVYGIFRDKLYLKREIDSRDERYRDMREQRDQALQLATSATDIARTSSEKMTEVLALLRAVR